MSATVEIHPASDLGAFTRERRYATGVNGGRLSMSVSRVALGGGFTVSWNVDRGAGWSKGWKATRATVSATTCGASRRCRCHLPMMWSERLSK